ncbi:hypothetical protein C5N14_27190 [Micromonospora sp. MW-13]|nr:hypothetical protein C5N14_27190 [Micromonospora sp. MW-13]
MPITRSPGARSVTPGPTSTTTPAPSLPITADGSGYIPNAINTSRKFTPAARMAMRTWPASRGAGAAGARPIPSRVPGAVAARCHSPSGGVRSSPAEAPVRVRRGERISPPRTATCPPVVDGSSAAPASRSHSSGERSRSTSARTIRSGCSDCAERSRPHTAAPTGSRSSSAGRAVTAPRVTTTSRVSASSPAASQDWSTPSTCAVAVRTTAGTSASGGCGIVTGSSSRRGRSAVPAATAAARSATVGYPAAPGPAVPAASPSSTRPAGSVTGVTSSACQLTSNSDRAAAPEAAPPVISRSTSESTDTTGAPAPSTATTRTPVPARVSRTRSTDAPDACTCTPSNANGTRGPPDPSVSSRPIGCRAASSSAGCTPNRAASPATCSGRATSAYASPVAVHARRRPWNTGPYARPCPARAAYQPVRSTSDAPAGGHSPSTGSSAEAASSTPSACRAQPASSSSSGCECTVTSRAPDAPGAPTRTCTRAPPDAGSASGVSTVSSRTRDAPTSSPARTANSTNAVPGTTTEPATTCSANHGWVAAESRPVNTTSSPPASRTAAPSRPWPAAPRPAPETSPPNERSTAGQNRSRWNAYVGRSTGAAPDPAYTPAQSTPTPATCSSARPDSICRGPFSSRRREPTTTPGPPRSAARSSASWTATLSTGCGLTSTKTRKPSAISRSTTGASRTGSRRLRYQ